MLRTLFFILYDNNYYDISCVIIAVGTMEATGANAHGYISQCQIHVKFKHAVT